MRPLLTACLIVKNEASALPACLASIADVADEIVVVDTGSDDDTVRVAEALGARVFYTTWNDDYAAARNVSLSHARGAFILYIDADEELHPDDGPALLEALQSGTVDAVEMAIVSKLGDSDKTNVARYLRVFRNYPGVRFVHAIHEQIWPSLAPHAPRVSCSSLRIVHHGYDRDESALDAKRRRNLDSALAILEREPDNAFYLYHAGLGYLTLGEPERSIPWLERALRLAAPDEQPMIENTLAQAFFDRRDHARAERHLQRSVAAEPLQHHGWALLADVLLLGQRHAAAIVALRGALAVTESRLPTDVSPHRAVLAMKLGMCELLTHDPTRASETLEQALAGELSDAERATAERYLAMAQRMVLTDR